MRLVLDTETRTITTEERGEKSEFDLYTPQAFALLTRHWLRVGWSQKYSYGFTWLGRPVIQPPEDLIRIQEIIWRTRPDIIVETGVAHGGSLVFHASLLELLDRGKVIGIDIEIRAHNRAAIEAHPLAHRIELIEGSSVAPETIERVRRAIPAGARVMVLLDSNHTRPHVFAELEAYAPLVSPGCYLGVADGIMRDLHDVPGGREQWATDHPVAAVAEFQREHQEFVLETPPPLFQEGFVTEPATYWPDGWLRRL